MNGAESMFELVNYEGCMTEIIQIEPGKTVFSVPNGMRYVLLYVLGNAGAEFELDVVCESVLADPVPASNHSDRPTR